jgi:phosphate-selective porin OprO and OprP
MYTPKNNLYAQRIFVFSWAWLVVFLQPAYAAPLELRSTEAPGQPLDNYPAVSSAISGAHASYTKNGFQLLSDDHAFSLNIQNRIQLRYANPFDSDPRSFEDLKREESSFILRRARTKLTGHAYWDWLKYALQYDWKDPILRDFNMTIDKYPWARLWLGRGKVIYNDERVTSSGKQQFVNRSIVNDIFTVDRQEGLQILGNLFPGKWYDFSYAAGVFTGLGVGQRGNDDLEMMYSGRLQWNILGGEIPFSQSDLKAQAQPSLNLALAAATHQSKCTAFATSQNSCLSLAGFTPGTAGQYRINQAVKESRFRWQGVSINHELHWKEVIDHKADVVGRTNMLGGLVQVGYFPYLLFPLIPEHLELAGRYAFVDPSAARDNDLQQEFSAAINYFLNGHSNKLTLQISHLMIEDPSSTLASAAQRLWLQWDLSF